MRSILRPCRRSVGLVCVLVLLVVLAVPAAAAPGGAPLYCRASVVGRTPAGQFVLGPVTCDAGGVSLLTAATTHFTGAGGTGNAFEVSGITCDGWTNMPAGFVNTISSTTSICSVRHHDLNNLAGSSQVTGPGGPTNLTTLDNRTNSAVYY
jgi:hypothetical protein